MSLPGFRRKRPIFFPIYDLLHIGNILSILCIDLHNLVESTVPQYGFVSSWPHIFLMFFLSLLLQCECNTLMSLLIISYFLPLMMPSALILQCSWFEDCYWDQGSEQLLIWAQLFKASLA